MSTEIDLLLKGAHVVDPVNGLDEKRDVAICKGKIAAVDGSISSAGARRVIRLDGYTAIPGIIDTHVHASPLAGGSGAHRMLAGAGVTTALEMAGPVEQVWELMEKEGAGLNLACVHAVAPGLTVDSGNPGKAEIRKLLNKAVRNGAIGIKILGGHLPLTPAATRRCIEVACQTDRYCAFHAGTTESGSNIEGFHEAVRLAEGERLHLAHINSYCRGQINSSLDEAISALSALESSPHILSESYLSPINGTSGRMVDGRPFSKATPNSLEHYGYSPDYEGMKTAIVDGVVSIMIEEGGETVLQTGPQAAEKWDAAETNLMVSFDINPADSRFLLAAARSQKGGFIVDAISTDGGGIPRNVIIEMGLTLVEFKALSMSEFVRKASVNPAIMMGLTGKGSLSAGADADITVIDRPGKRAYITLVGGEVIMYDGFVSGNGGTALVLPEGEKQVGKSSLKVQTINPGTFMQKPEQSHR